MSKKSEIIHPICPHCGRVMAYGERFFSTHRHTFSKCVYPKCRFHGYEGWLGDIALNKSERKAYEKAVKSGKLGKWADMVHYPCEPYFGIPPKAKV